MIRVIIPAYNEEAALPLTLDRLFRQRGHYDVRIVDGGSTDRTREIADSHPSIRLLAAPKGRASQMNAGARHAIQDRNARDDWFLFLHADTLLPDGAMERLEAMASDLSIQAGGFHHRFAGGDRRLRLISWLNNFRCRYSRVIYGDQAMFVRQGLFERLGGFPDQPILEDVAFSEKFNRLTSPVLLEPPVLTDPRKFIQMGVWRSFARVLMIILCVELHLPVRARSFFQDIR